MLRAIYDGFQTIGEEHADGVPEDDLSLWMSFMGDFYPPSGLQSNIAQLVAQLMAQLVGPEQGDGNNGDDGGNNGGGGMAVQ